MRSQRHDYAGPGPGNEHEPHCGGGRGPRWLGGGLHARGPGPLGHAVR
ncbi:MAG: hypothetical protein AAGH99_05630 [Planctomycetota bacterium]